MTLDYVSKFKGRSIAVYSDNPPVGGVYQFNHSLLRQLATSRFQTSSVQIQHSGELIEEQKELGVSHYWISEDFISGYARSYIDLKTVRSLFRQIQPDLIVFSDGWPVGNFAAKQVAIELGIPFVVVVGFVDENSSKVDRDDGIPYSKAASYQYAQAEEFVAVSKQNLDLLHESFFLNSERGKVIHYGRPASFFQEADSSVRQRIRAELNIPIDAVVCFTSARLAHVKGYDLQIEAIKALKNQPRWEQTYFVWAGCGIRGESQENELKQKVLALEVGNHVQFLGRRSDIPDLLAASDVYILPSRAEGMPLAIMEAMAKGLPVIASAVSGIPEELADTGKLLFDPKIDPERTISELTETIRLWIESSQIRLDRGSACQQRANLLFKEDRMLLQYLELIDNTFDNLSEFNRNAARDRWTKRCVLTSQDRKSIERRVQYAALVWQAWEHFQQGNLAEMAYCCKSSLRFSPFLRTETIQNWIDMFSTFGREHRVRLAVYSLCQSQEWKSLIEETLASRISA